MGIELFYRGAPRPRASWTAGYTVSRVEDRVEGLWVPRATDEPHALELAGHLQMPHEWTLSATWLYHTGWPTTRVGGRVASDGEGQEVVEPVLGPIRGERLPDYHRLDLRLGRGWDLGRGRLTAYLDLQNVYGRNNLRGFESFRFALGAEGEPEAFAEPVRWVGFVPSFGVRWSF
jgi:hypothetical protein